MEQLTLTGYKQTEVGLIPEDWEVNPLENYFSYISYGFTNPMPTLESGIYMITAKDINNGRIDYSSARKTSKKAYSSLLTNKSKPKKDDILLTKDGSLGRLAIVGEEIVCINQSVAVIRPNQKIDGLFLKKLLESSYYQRVMIENAGGSTIKHIYITRVNLMLIGVPPNVTEQKAIAQVLSDTDTLIQALEKKIEKKKLIKKGVMQELLTPKEGWATAPLVSVVDYIHGKAHEQDIDANGKYIVVNSKFISTNGEVRKYSNRNNCKARKGDVLTVLSDLPNGKALAKCYSVSENNKYAVNQRICIWRPKGNNNSIFLKYLLNRHKYFLSLDDGVTQTHILNHHIEKCNISFPVDCDEQKRIGIILLELDDEIMALESKLSKYQKAKQGMMQQLLTGKIRLI